MYENDRTRVSRTVLPTGERVIRKEFRGSAAARRLRHELSVLRRLAGVPGVPDLVTAVDQPDVICLADAGGVPLTTLLTGGPLPVDELLELAVELATVIAAVHRHGVMHKDINPANVIAIGGSPSRPVLIDYDLASTFAVERPGFTHHTEIAGTLAYMAPEQTGRTGWAVDQRADLYGLGSTLYELATGGPPFGDGDPLQLTHDHLTRVPTPPSEVNPDVPAALSAVIGRLLEKEPDSRYQSAEGALHDLRRLRQQRTEGRALAINLGERDFPWRLAAPSRPIGRDAEIALLADALADAVAGRCRGVL
ncbi:MAG TPA: serine/threonine-protein kinase, partial [Micromonosporaceae bacterium]|nr:serine/threonine-protein kinase [Micromonosporaceae bacterium]